MELIIIIIVAVIILKMKSNAIKKKEKQRQRELEIRERQQYSTVLQTVSAHPRNVVGCKDGTIYTITGNGLGRVIGSYKKGNAYSLDVFDESERLIGGVSLGSSGSIRIYLTLYGIIDSNPYSREIIIAKRNDVSWCAAETIDGAIIDCETCYPIFHYDGNAQEASAAFVCWAYEGYDNKYSDFYRI